MQFLHRHLLSSLRRHHLLRHQTRHIYLDAFSLDRPSDGGLDVAVKREFNLRPLLNLKDHIASHPSNSLPYSQIASKRQLLQLPIRPMDFIRSYPRVFEEVIPGSIVNQPDIKLTPEAVNLHAEEELLYQSLDYKQDVASRLLKLLMINRVNRIPVGLVERLRWELGLPRDYKEAIVPEFPDYFQVVTGKKSGLKEIELVLWTDEFAVSEKEKGVKGGEVWFDSHYSSKHKFDKKYERWLREWQKLPYVSPYENATRLLVESDASDRWIVGVLHEVLNLFVGKKVERESLICLGECLGLKARFKLAILQHPGIFYSSGRYGAKTIVLREAYKRGTLINNHALVDLRFKYVQLMRSKVGKVEPSEKAGKSRTKVRKDEIVGDEDSESEQEDGAVMDDWASSSEEDGAVRVDSSEEEEDVAVINVWSEDDNDDDEEEEDEEGGSRRSNGRRTGVQMDGYGPRRSRKDSDNYGKDNRRGMSNRGSQRFEEESVGKNVERRSNGSSTRAFGYESSRRFEAESVGKNVERRSNGSSTRAFGYESSRRFSRRNDARSDKYFPRNSKQISDFYVNGEGRSAMKRGRSNRDYNFLGEKKVRSNAGWSSNEKYESGKKLSRKRDNVRGEPDVSTRSTDCSDLPRNSLKLKTERSIS